MAESTQRPKAGLRNFAFACVIGVAIAFLVNMVFGERPLATIALDGKPFVEQIVWGTVMALGVGVPIVVDIRPHTVKGPENEVSVQTHLLASYVVTKSATAPTHTLLASEM